MTDLVLKIWREMDMTDRKAKCEARAKAYWLGHSMSRFNSKISVCKSCNATMELTVDGVSGDAVEKHCTQQLLPLNDDVRS